MSGGLDSFVTAMLLKEKGYEVTGVKLDLWDHDDRSELDDVCNRLGIQLLHCDGRELFRRVVVDDFVRGYIAAYTPSPCCICNGCVKWQLLKETADEMNIRLLATGHYVRIAAGNGKYFVFKGVDSDKDQSYFLWSLSQDILSRAITPLGLFTKGEVRKLAADRGYMQMVRKKESMGICFLHGRDYREFIREYVPDFRGSEGDIVDRIGNVIGRHKGLLNYTIGQRQGIPCVGGRPMYVARMDAGRNVITADLKEGLQTMTLCVGHVVVADSRDLQADDLQVKVRGIGLNPKGYVKKVIPAESGLRVLLSDPAWAVAPGQPVAFYRGERLVGGGLAL